MSKLKQHGLALTQITLFIFVFLGPFVEQDCWPNEPKCWHFQENVALLMLSVSLIAIAAFLVGIATRFGIDPNSPFNILPVSPKPRYLVTTGIYRYIRHPQALGWLIGALGYLLIMDARWSWFLWPICLIFFIIEIPYEEGLLKHMYPEYETYMEGTYRLLPFIW
jgi:protein-S-isoprenylcysteine O-methyltransferase Ste14